MLLPALNQAREAAKTTVCAAKLKQLGMGVQMYTDMNNGVFPPYYMTNPGFLYSWQNYVAMAMQLGNEETAREYLHYPSDPRTYNPTDPGRWVYWCSYGGNEYLGFCPSKNQTSLNISSVTDPTHVMLLVDSTYAGGWCSINIYPDSLSLYNWLDWRHPLKKGYNILFCDGHVNNSQPQDFTTFKQYLIP